MRLIKVGFKDELSKKTKTRINIQQPINQAIKQILDSNNQIKK